MSIILHWSLLCWSIIGMLCFAQVDFGSDTILQGQQLRDWQFLSSVNGRFALQFFSPAGTSKHRYLGIFLHGQNMYERTDHIVWVGNRNNPINDPSGTLVINSTDGMLNIVYSGGTIFLPTTLSARYRIRNINTSATLQDDGNFVLRQVYRDGSFVSERVVWQSFDYPTDTLLPGMKLGVNLKTGHQWLLTSWIRDDVPSSGSFTLGVDRNNSDRLVIWWHKNVFWTSELWHNDSFGNSWGLPNRYISNDNELYFTSSYISLRLTPYGKVLEIPWNFESAGCELSSVVSQPAGCVHYSFPDCMKGDDNRFIWNRTYYYRFASSIKEENSNLSIIDCAARCMQNCSCYGCTSLHENGTGCEYWGKEAAQFLGSYRGDKLVYLRAAVSARATTEKKGQKWWIWLVTAVSGTILLLIISILLLIRRKNRVKAMWEEEQVLMLHDGVNMTTLKTGEMIEKNEKKMSQVNLIKFETIEMATNNFSAQNKLGEGGFGPVYKGKLLGGPDIAVKRLPRSSNQGISEFKNEIQLIIKLQHTNLVKLLGCCIHRDEMLLVYEYMPNKSLDFFLFDHTRIGLLTWRTRTNIVEGIAHGLQYLHKHSRLRVIHRDLKPSNILLDENMTPKISDFGMARIFGMKDSETNTKRIVGTHGYMSPEYAIQGIVSTKTDVFSFGVLVLEIVSGKKSHRSYHSERPLNLIGLAWELWINGKALDLVDNTMGTYHQNEVQRYINIGLLCVQDSATDRPSMTDVLLMMTNESLTLQTPKQPAFFLETSNVENDREESLQKNCSNKMSTSIMEAR